MSLTVQANVLHSVTANVIQGMQRASNFGGMEIAKPLPQATTSANWPVILLADNFGITDAIKDRARGADFQSLDATISLDTSIVTGEGIEVPVDKNIINDATKSGLDVLSAFGTALMKVAFIRHEKTVAGIAQGAGFDSVNSGVAYTTANKASADPIEDILAAIERVAGRGESPDAVVIPVEVWTRIRTFDRMRQWVAGQVNPGAAVTSATLAQSLEDEGIRRVIIGRARENTANKGRTPVISPIWANTHIWVGSTDAAAETGDGNSLGNSIATFYLDNQPAPYFVENYYCNRRRSEILRVFGETNVKIINAQAGTRIATQYA